MFTQTNATLRQRFAYGFTALVFALTFTLTVSPAARVYAAKFLTQIGVLNISDRPVGEPVLIASPSPEQAALANATATPIPSTLATMSPMDAAVFQAGFTPFLSNDLPQGYTFDDVVAAEYLDDDQIPHGMGIFVTYRSENGGYISLHTNLFDNRQQDLAMGGQKITDVLINGTPGVWIEEFPSQTEAGIEEIDMLLWQDGKYVLSIQSNQLSLNEVIKLAESLKQ
ncbi:MAG TPA: DUF4367 domain-containing protein [Anaerolineales bacterium]|nr:DUF4367 domain-containing protein [Anaerolineales bacterium]